jgi:DnaJ-domain-containing protein 1
VSIDTSPTRATFNHLAEFADVLEQLESEFYKQALAKFKDNDFTAAGFSSSQVAVEQFTTIQCDEATHSTVLQVCKPYALFTFL